MTNQEGGFLRKIGRAIPGTEENKKGEAVHGLYEQKKIEDHERIVSTLERQKNLLKGSDLLIRVGELTRAGIRELDLKTLSPELNEFYSKELPELDEKNPQNERLASRVLGAAGSTIMDLFEERGPGRQVGTRARMVDITNDNLNNMLGWAIVDENATLTWRTALDQTEDYNRRVQDKPNE